MEKHTIVPPHFQAADLLAPNFRKRSYYHVKREEIHLLEDIGAVELMDEQRWIWRYVGFSLCPDSFRVGTARVSSQVDDSVMAILVSEITRPHHGDGACQTALW